MRKVMTLLLSLPLAVTVIAALAQDSEVPPVDEEVPPAGEDVVVNPQPEFTASDVVSVLAPEDVQRLATIEDELYGLRVGTQIIAQDGRSRAALMALLMVERQTILNRLNTSLWELQQ